MTAETIESRFTFEFELAAGTKAFYGDVGGSLQLPLLQVVQSVLEPLPHHVHLLT